MADVDLFKLSEFVIKNKCICVQENNNNNNKNILTKTCGCTSSVTDNKINMLGLMSKIELHWLEGLETGQSWKGSTAESMPAFWSGQKTLLWQTYSFGFCLLFPSFVSVWWCFYFSESLLYIIVQQFSFFSMLNYWRTLIRGSGTPPKCS